MDTSLDDLKIPTIADIGAPDDEPPRDPLEFLLDVMQGKRVASQTELRAAVAAAQYLHTKRGDAGKKDERAKGAVEAAQGRFGVRQTPLKLVNGGA